MSHSPDSTLSANSCLTDCGIYASDCESVVSATCKRKRDCESGTPLPLAMNHKEIFHPHLYLASSSSEVEVVGYEDDTSGRERIIEKCYAMIKEKGQGQDQMLLLPCTSNELTYSALQKNIGYISDKECGYRGALAMQYGKDMSSLNLNEFEKFNMLQIYGPVSAEYMAIAENDEEARLKVLRLLVDSPIGSIHSNSWVNSHKKRK